MSGESHNDSSIVVQRWLFLLRLLSMAKKRCKNSNSFHEGAASFASDYTRIQEIVSKEICFSKALS